MKAAVAVARKLGVKKLCVVAGEETQGLSRDAQTQAVVESLKAGGKVVEPEDHPDPRASTSSSTTPGRSSPPNTRRVIPRVGSPNVKILFDIYHQQITEGNLSGNIRKYKDLIGYFQLADHPGRHEPGTGEINYAHVLRLIHEIGYR